MSKLYSLKEKFNLTVVYLVSVLLNGVFLCIWVAVQYGIAFILQLLSTDRMTKWIILTFRIIFALSTLLPIIIRLYTDIRIMVIRSAKEIEKERES